MCINCAEVLEQVSDLKNCLAASAKGGYAHFCLVHMSGGSRNHAQGTHVNTKLTVIAALSDSPKLETLLWPPDALQ